MILAVASGKGGTGKTTVAANLARAMAGPVQLLDCDVEAPNAHLFLRGPATGEETVSIPVPEVDPAKCAGCGACSRFCQYHAIVSLKNHPLVFAELCHGCGGCIQACPSGALHEIQRRVGVVESFEAGNVSLVHGRLDVGAPLAVPVVRAVKRRIDPSATAIIDAPPGTSCPVVASVKGADFLALVTEPTPFGLHDLRLAVDLAREMGLAFGVVLNRAGAGDGRVHAYCRRQAIPILAEIPDDRLIAQACSRGELLIEALPHYRTLFKDLANELARRSKAPQTAAVEWTRT